MVQNLVSPEELAHISAERILRISGVSRFKVGVVLGSGWSDAAELIGSTVSELNANELDGFAPSRIPGHSGKIWALALPNGEHALVFGARSHLYEGNGVTAVVHPIRVAAAAGARTIVLTNGAGGIDDSWAPGTPILISDHINLTGTTPLAGPNFVDLTDLYSRRLRDLAKEIDPTLQEGVYVQFRGPQYETPAEVQMAKRMGGHIVGMSTALEAIAARASGMNVLGLSLITNLAAGISAQPLSHQEVLDAGEAVKAVISRLLAKIVQSI